jgi:archaellum component FlaC
MESESLRSVVEEKEALIKQLQAKVSSLRKSGQQKDSEIKMLNDTLSTLETDNENQSHEINALKQESFQEKQVSTEMITSLTEQVNDLQLSVQQY